MRRLLGFLAVISAVFAASSSGKDGIVLKLSTDKNGDGQFNHFYGEWLESPWGDLYQFRAGGQNWLTAREHCLSLNSDLAVVRDQEQLNWILSHYAPLNSRFGERLVQIGLYSPEGTTTHEWKWVDGSEISKQLEWAPGEPYDHTMEGKERCGLLSVEKRKLDDVDCGLVPSDYQSTRYVCQRSSEKHKQQQKSNNYIWGKIEQLFSFFGIGGTPSNATATTPADYEDEVKHNETVKFTDATSSEETSSEEEESVIKTLAALPRIEGSGETAVLKELEGAGEGIEGSGQIVDKSSIERSVIEILDEKKLDSMISKMEEMIKSIDDLTVSPSTAELERTTVANVENPEKPQNDEAVENSVSESIEDDFDETKTKDMPKADIVPPKEEDCDEEEGSGSGEKPENDTEIEIDLPKEKEDHIKEFLGVLRLFLDRAEHGDLRKLLDDKSGKTLLERMKNAIREANKREFEMLEKLEDQNSKDELIAQKTNQMSATEQKEIYRKISSAVMKAAKQDAEIIKKRGDTEGSGNENYELAKEKIEGKVTVLKSAKESTSEKEQKHEPTDDYYGDYLDENNVVKVSNGQKREKRLKKKAEEEKKSSKEEGKEDKKDPIEGKGEAEKTEDLKNKVEEQEEPKEAKEKKDDHAETVTEEKKEEAKAEEKEESKTEEKKEESKTEEKKEEPKEEKKEVPKAEEKEEPKAEEKEETKTQEKKEEPKAEVKEEPKTEEKKEEPKTEEKKEEPKTEEKKEEPKTEEREDPKAEEKKPEETTLAVEKKETEPETTQNVETTTTKTEEKPEKVEEKKHTKHAKAEKEKHHDKKHTKKESAKHETHKPKKEEKQKKEKPAEKKTKPAEANEDEEEEKENTTAKKHEKTEVKTKKVDGKELEKLSKKEAAEKVTLLPPLPTLPTLPTIPPFSFPAIPTTTTTTAKPVTPVKFPTLEEILGNLNDNFKKLLAPPKPLPAPKI